MPKCLHALFAGGLSVLGLALMALAAFLNRHTLRVLTAVEMLRAERAGRA